MAVYLDLVVILNFLVDFLLLLGTNRLSGHPPGAGRAALAAAVGGVYGGWCLLPGFRFLGGTLWRTVCMAGMGAVAFGCSASGLRRGMLFVLLSMAMGGMALLLGSNRFWALASAAGSLCVLCAVGFHGHPAGRQLVPVELCYDGKKMSFLALRDTGNTLRDPITGKPVLVVGGDVAEALTGLSESQLRHPVETVGRGTLPGLRLIPCRTVGEEAGMLLTLRIADMKVDNRRGNGLVALAPGRLTADGSYQALTGGEL